MSGRRKAYPSDLSDAEWKYIEPLIPPPKPAGRPRTTDMWEVVNAIFYVVRSGCAWRMLAHDYPPGKPSIITSGSGGRMGPGNESTTRCVARYAAKRGATKSRVQRFWTASRSRRRKEGELADMRLPRRSTGANGTCSLTPWGCFWPWWSMLPTSRIGMEPDWFWKRSSICCLGYN